MAETGGVGDLDDIGEFGIGRALRDSKPVTKIELSKEKEAEIAAMNNWEEYEEQNDDLIQQQEEAGILAKMRKKKNMNSERRQPIDRQTAFIEFKESDEAKQLEVEILDARQNTKQKRIDLKT